VVLILIRITELHPFLVINIHLFESTLITELKSHFFCFLQVQWLIDNYETAEGVSLVHVPPCTPNYLRHCNDYKLEPVNTANWAVPSEDWAPGWNISFDFSKSFQIEFIYFWWKNRGNFKYHYYVIRVSNRRRRWIKCR
jgi:hypothetical protein